MTTDKKVPVATRKPLPMAGSSSFTMGCDPEFFFRMKKRVIGSEHIIPKEGFFPRSTVAQNTFVSFPNTSSKFVIDGVQAELNPNPYGCRANMANEIAACFRSLKVIIDKKKEAVQVDFSRTVKITKTELSKLDPNNQRFGCMPSFNAYPDGGVNLGEVDPLVYRYRSAGGHIHISHNEVAKMQAQFKDDPATFIKMMDIIVGNTCVLLDRDRGNITRRKTYGRAGEFRLPKHGIEYRVLSNFWLTSYPLMSMVFGLSRLVMSMFNSPSKDVFIKQFTEAVDEMDIRNAINTNNYRLAYKNFKKIEQLLIEATGQECFGSLPFDGRTMKAFNYFFEKIKENGLKYWFKEDPFDHWCNLPEAHGSGAHHFLVNVVTPEMQRNEKKS